MPEPVTDAVPATAGDPAPPSDPPRLAPELLASAVRARRAARRAQRARLARLTAGGLAMTALAAGLAGCGSGVSPAAAGRALPACAGSALSARAGELTGGAGHQRLVVVLHTTQDRCLVTGYPTVGLVVDGRTVRLRNVHGADPTFPAVPARGVLLTSDGSASFDVGTREVPEGDETCVDGQGVRVTAPGATAPTTVRVEFGACGGRVTVSPVTGGPGGVAAG